MRRVERLVNLLAYLLTTNRPVTADDIRHTIPGYDQGSDAAFKRMFERDKDELREMGIPIRLLPTDAWAVEEGYRIDPEEYALPPIDLTDEERAALLVAASAVRFGAGGDAERAVLKLGGGVGAEPGPLSAELGGDPGILGRLTEAVGARRRIRFRYHDRERVLEPYVVGHQRGHWYFAGRDVDRDEIRIFRTDRADTLRLEAETFERPAHFDAAEVLGGAPWEQGDAPVTARVRFGPRRAFWGRRQLGAGAVVREEPDGSFVADIAVARVDAFVTWLLTAFRDDDAVVLSPPEVRDAVLARVRAALAGANR